MSVSPWVDQTALKDVYATVLGWAQETVRKKRLKEAHLIIGFAFSMVHNTNKFAFTTSSGKGDFLSLALPEVEIVCTYLRKIATSKGTDMDSARAAIDTYMYATTGMSNGWGWYMDRAGMGSPYPTPNEHKLSLIPSLLLGTMDVTKLSMTPEDMAHFATALRYMDDQSRVDKSLRNHPAYVNLDTIASKEHISAADAFFLRTMLTHTRLQPVIRNLMDHALSLEELWQTQLLLATAVHIWTQQPGYTVDVEEFASMVEHTDATDLPVSLMAHATAIVVPGYTVESIHEQMVTIRNLLTTLSTTTSYTGEAR